MTAAPPVSHNSHLVPTTLPRYHPIAINPTPSMHPDMMQNHHFRHFTLHDPQTGPPPAPPAPAPSSLDQIEARLRQLEHEEMNRMAARSHLLAVRKREDEEFRRMTELAEAEEDVSK
ncbi:hypothetical protein N7495_000170 [Penicillium taxi]|uniref:uncharacterized protein n=1 Tax=Penicillium taxi TaxID=168475 RepID=UPI002545674F|nr:uncharacterized protein N7495_000170 [Penicillium taxi]KAJ5907488.1 hypothetical protein N7495_000170 [Penicillium taxi]